MRNIKITSLLLFLLISTCAFAQIVDIPDANFKNVLVNTNAASTMSYVPGQNYWTNYNVDANNDGEIQEWEASLVKGLWIDGQNVSSLIGIEAFVNLEFLILSNNPITSLDLSSNIKLIRATIEDNQITDIDVSGCVDLVQLYIEENITSIDITSSVNLVEFWNQEGDIASIDVSNNVNLESLALFNNLTSLDVSNNINLIELYCSGNQLSILDVSNNTNLIDLNCWGNQLSSLDVSACGSLETLVCVLNPISELFLKNGFVSSSGYNIDNPSLQYICVDEGEQGYISNLVDASVNINSYCSFTPGGNYNTIIGNVSLDINNNGCDINDITFPLFKVSIDDGTESGSTFTNNSGVFEFYTEAGNFTLTPSIENPTYFNVSPSEAIINFPDNNNNTAQQDFCITANGVHPDVEVVLVSTLPARPGFDAEYLITYRNKGNQAVSGEVIFNYDDAVLDFENSTEIPTSESTGTLSWGYSNLIPFETRTIYVTLNVNSPMETPAVNIDDQLDFTVTINPVVGDDMPSDNVFDYEQIVIGSYDPNDITCIEGDIVDPAEIGDYLHYLIRFENTGNAAAENVIVKSEVDPTQFDINTLQFLNSTHNADIRITNNTIEFIFEGINLGANGGQGDILFRIKTKESIETNDTVTKNAEIFFDYNFPIETNDANTTFALLSNTEFELDSSVSLYPNPVKNVLNIKAKNIIKSVSLYDVQGRLLQTEINSNNQLEFNISSHSNGVYFIKIITEKGINLEKIIKD